MAKRNVEKLILIGLGTANPNEILKLAREEKMPALAALIRGGTVASNCLAPYPTNTLADWTSIVTGAWPGTHGLGSPAAGRLSAVPLWNAAANEGKRSILIECPGASPSEPRADAEISLNDWKAAETCGGQAGRALCGAQLFTTAEKPGARTINLRPAQGWTDVAAQDALEFEVPLSCPKSLSTLHGLLLKESGEYHRAAIYRSKDAEAPIFTLRKGDWSGKITIDTQVGQERIKAVFMANLLDLSPAGDTFSLFLTPVVPLGGWAWPSNVEEALADIEGLPLPGSPFEPLRAGWIDHKTCFELVQILHSWYTAAAVRLMETREWQLFFMHDPILGMMHRSLPDHADSRTAESPEQAKASRELMQGVYESFDGMIARILEKADRRTLVVIASDHGAIPRGCNLDLEKVLAAAGILALRDDASVDWSNTKAAPLGDAHVFVNLKGREPDGAVDPADYENVREEVINALMDHVEPESGKHPIAFALRREDARILGLYGDHVGDVIFCVEPGHGLGQGQHLPTARWGSCTLRSFLVMAGPNVKKGAQLERNVWLVDIAPTICYLMDIPFPETMEGAILYQALQDPNSRLTEKGRLKANHERLKRAYDAEISLTHTYNR